MESKSSNTYQLHNVATSVSLLASLLTISGIKQWLFCSLYVSQVLMFNMEMKLSKTKFNVFGVVENVSNFNQIIKLNRTMI